MPLLGGLLVTLFSGLAQFFVQFVSRKVAIGAAAVAALGVITLALLATMRGVIQPLAAALIPDQYNSFIGLAFPPIAGTCVTTLGVVWGATTLYGWQRKALDLFVKA